MDNESFSSQLSKLPSEFSLEMEKQKQDRFEDVLKTLVKVYNIEDEFDKSNETERNNLISIFKAFHDFGFYGGVSFTLDPDIKYNKQL